MFMYHSAVESSSNSSFYATKIASQAQSTAFIKKMLTLIISTITHNRRIFPRHAFVTIEESDLKVLSKETKLPQVNQAVELLSGCFDAINHQYLRGIHVEISPADEQYFIGLTYHAGNYRERREEDQLINSLSDLTNSSTPLSGAVSLNIRLLYYDEVTPLHYEPRGFLPSTLPAEITNSSLIGVTTTQWHSLALSFSPSNSLSQSIHSDSVMTGECVESPYFGVNCPCGCQENDGLMIICNRCRHWQHAICFSILEQEEAPNTHVCYNCAKANKHINEGTDKTLTRQSLRKVKKICLFRKSLLALTETDQISVGGLSDRLGISPKQSTFLIKKLEEHDFIVQESSRALFRVIKRNLSMGLVDHLPLHSSKVKHSLQSDDSVVVFKRKRILNDSFCSDL